MSTPHDSQHVQQGRRACGIIMVVVALLTPGIPSAAAAPRPLVYDITKAVNASWAAAVKGATFTAAESPGTAQVTILKRTYAYSSNSVYRIVDTGREQVVIGDSQYRRLSDVLTATQLVRLQLILPGMSWLQEPAGSLVAPIDRQFYPLAAALAAGSGWTRTTSAKATTYRFSVMSKVAVDQQSWFGPAAGTNSRLTGTAVVTVDRTGRITKFTLSGPATTTSLSTSAPSTPAPSTSAGTKSTAPSLAVSIVYGKVPIPTTSPSLTKEELYTTLPDTAGLSSTTPWEVVTGLTARCESALAPLRQIETDTPDGSNLSAAQLSSVAGVLGQMTTACTKEERLEILRREVAGYLAGAVAGEEPVTRP